MDILKDKCRVHPLTKQMPKIKRKLSKVFKKQNTANATSYMGSEMKLPLFDTGLKYTTLFTINTLQLLITGMCL